MFRMPKCRVLHDEVLLDPQGVDTAFAFRIRRT